MLPVYTVHNSASPIAIEISINIASCVYEMFCKGILSSRALLYYLCSDIECTRQGKARRVALRLQIIEGLNGLWLIFLKREPSSIGANFAATNPLP